MDYHAECYCGVVKLAIQGDPVVQCYCHCSSCRKWSGQPVTACILWPEAQVNIVAGRDQMHRHSNTDHPEGGKFSCKICGGAIGTFLPGSRMYDIFGGVLRDFTFQPSSHINYQERVFDLVDGLPKFRDMPEMVGGSGVMLNEAERLAP